MTLTQLQEIVRTVTIQETMGLGGAIVVKGLTLSQLRELFLLAQSQLCELECRAALKPNNPS